MNNKEIKKIKRRLKDRLKEILPEIRDSICEYISSEDEWEIEAHAWYPISDDLSIVTNGIEEDIKSVAAQQFITEKLEHLNHFIVNGLYGEMLNNFKEGYFTIPLLPLFLVRTNADGTHRIMSDEELRIAVVEFENISKYLENDKKVWDEGYFHFDGSDPNKELSDCFFYKRYNGIRIKFKFYISNSIVEKLIA